MSNPNEEQITSKQIQIKGGMGQIVFKYIDTIKCKECGEEFTNEWIDGGFMGQTEEQHGILRAKLRDHKSKVHQIGDNLCNKCKTQLFDYSGEQFSWYTNEKHGQVCSSCLKELEKQGELWDNFFKIRIYKCVPGSADPGQEFFSACGYCKEGMLEQQNHKEENGKTTIKHKCQLKCSCCKPEKSFELTQEYLNWSKKYNMTINWCSDCQIKKLEQNGNKPEALKELKKLTGKRNNDDWEREREREKFPNFELELLN